MKFLNKSKCTVNCNIHVEFLIRLREIYNTVESRQMNKSKKNKIKDFKS